MQIVIEIPDDVRKSIENGSFGVKYNIYDLCGWIMDGKIIPKGHGRLIDADVGDLQAELFTYTRYTGIDEAPYEDACTALENAPTVIPSDKEEEE